MSNATLPAQRVDSSLQSSLLRQLERCKNYPASLRETLEVDPYAFLAAQLENYKFLWRDREQGPVQVALGAARHIQALPNESPRSLLGRCRQSIAGMPADQRLVGGFAFCPHGQPLPSPWENFGRGEFWLPRIRLQENQIEVVVIDEDDVAAARAAIRHLIVAEKEFDEVWPAYETRTDLPDFAGWSRNIQQATDLFTAEVLEKVVLARQVTLRFPAPLDAWAILSRLASVTPNCFQFGFQTAAESVFLGATPERLFQRNGESLSSEVVAGTRRRGSTAEEDLRLGHELLASEKDQLEHHIVRKSIRQRLHGCVEGLEVDARAALLQLANKQHLYSRVTGRLRADVRDEDLLERLHPTPAVGGYPTENALVEIERLETFERGWYAAPVGWISQGASEFVVAIRSALLRGRDLHLYSGAGIVPGSTAKSEWDEVESKIQDFLQFMSAESPLLR